MPEKAISQDQPPDSQENLPAASLLSLDVAGRKGADGADGVSYLGQQAPMGVDGRTGGNAGLAQAGENAGSIRISLASEGDERVNIDGQAVLPKTAGRPIHESLDIGQSGSIFLVAHGGDGGQGDSGGDGEAGGKGRDGADANQFSSGANGRPGADGGDGGLATHGRSLQSRHCSRSKIPAPL